MTSVFLKNTNKLEEMKKIRHKLIGKLKIKISK